MTHPLSSADIGIFSSEISKFCYIKNTETETILVFYFFFLFLEFLTILLINVVTVLMMSVKLATLGFLKIKISRNICYDVIIPDYDITNEILSRDSNDTVDVVMWPRFGKSLVKFGISIREVIITSILQGFDQKNHFFWGVVLH